MEDDPASRFSWGVAYFITYPIRPPITFLAMETPEIMICFVMNSQENITKTRSGNGGEWGGRMGYFLHEEIPGTRLCAAKRSRTDRF